MINFFTETDFKLHNQAYFKTWIEAVILSEKKDLGDINYIFCNDEYLHEINLKYLQHDTFTDIITFDSTEENILNSDVFISIERVKENATNLAVDFEEELKRVIIHGILHLCGYTDYSVEEKAKMRLKEEEKIEMFHVEQ